MHTNEQANTIQKTSDICREWFDHFGLTYKDVDDQALFKLQARISHYLKCSSNALEMSLSHLRSRDVKYDSNGKIEYLYLMVDGPHFQRREAISFNKDGFIGFAGWASSNNEKPFTDAFRMWIHNDVYSDKSTQR